MIEGLFVIPIAVFMSLFVFYRCKSVRGEDISAIGSIFLLGLHAVSKLVIKNNRVVKCNGVLARDIHVWKEICDIDYSGRIEIMVFKGRLFVIGKTPEPVKDMVYDKIIDIISKDKILYKVVTPQSSDN